MHRFVIGAVSSKRVMWYRRTSKQQVLLLLQPDHGTVSPLPRPVIFENDQMIASYTGREIYATTDIPPRRVVRDRPRASCLSFASLAVVVMLKGYCMYERSVTERKAPSNQTSTAAARR